MLIFILSLNFRTCATHAITNLEEIKNHGDAHTISSTLMAYAKTAI